MLQGIYCYIDKKENKVIYVGKDSHIDEDRRYNAHFSKCNYNSQKINQVLQNNPKRYIYKILEEGSIPQKILNALEMCFIQKYNPKFNFTKGGDGLSGYKMTEEHKKNISKATLGRKFSESHKKKLSKKAFGNSSHLGFIHSKETKDKISYINSKNNNKLGYYRVYKQKIKNNSKRDFCYSYRYTDDNGKRHKISSIDLKKLEKKVKEKGLPWICFNEVV